MILADGWSRNICQVNLRGMFIIHRERTVWSLRLKADGIILDGKTNND